MGAKAQLKRDLIAAQQQRDRALADLADCERDLDAARAEINRLRVRKPSLVDQARDRVRNWLDELTNALGVGW